MRRLALLALASAVAAGEGDLEREIEAFIAAIRQDHAAGTAAPFSSRVDVDEFVAEIGRQGVPTDPIAGAIPKLLERFDQMPLETFRLRKAEATADGAIAVLDARDEYGAITRFRLFLVRRGGVWKVRDIDALEFGFRVSAVIGIVAQAATGRQAVPALLGFCGGLVALREEDYVNARKLLEGARGLPDKLDALRLLCLGCALNATSEYADALKACEEAERKHADAPIVHYMRAVALSGLDRHEEAVAAAGRFVAIVGETPDASELIGDALAALGRNADAAGAYRSGLREDPTYTRNLYGLLVVLPPGTTEDIAEHLRRTGDASGTFLDIGWDLAEAEQWAALRALVAAHTKLEPGDLWIEYFTVRLLRADGKPLDALAKLSGSLPKVPNGEDRSYFTELHAELAVECGKTIETYEAIPETFEDLATALDDAADVHGLAALVSRRAQDGKPDGALRWWTIEVAWLEGRDEDVVRLAVLHEGEIRDAGCGELDDRWIRSLVSLRREEDALRQARRVADEDDDRFYVLLVRVGFGRSAEAIREFGRCVEKGADPADLYLDAELAPLTKDDAYAPLRARYPPPEEDE